MINIFCLINKSLNPYVRPIPVHGHSPRPLWKPQRNWWDRGGQGCGGTGHLEENLGAPFTQVLDGCHVIPMIPMIPPVKWLGRGRQSMFSRSDHGVQRVDVPEYIYIWKNTWGYIRIVIYRTTSMRKAITNENYRDVKLIRNVSLN